MNRCEAAVSCVLAAIVLAIVFSLWAAEDAAAGLATACVFLQTVSQP